MQNTQTLQNLPVQVSKMKWGWNATTEIELETTPEGQRVLDISTYRPDGRDAVLISRASVATVTDGGRCKRHIIGFCREGDYRATVFRQECPRVTEKAVRQQHAMVLEHLAQIRARALQHYAP